MTTQTFREFIRGARVTNTITGDLVDDMKHTSTLPETFDSLPQLRSYLRFHNACDEALGAAPAVWRRFERWRDKERPRRSPAGA